MRIGLRTGWVFLFALGCGSSPSAPTDEAGFVDVPPRLDAAYDARLFYSFRKADVVSAPVAIFFNGGPGFATSFGLLPWGTGPFAIDLATRAVALNRASWTSFANLLYVDERQSGFSYGLAGTPEMAGCKLDPVADAADFVRVLIHFLDAHPAFVRMFLTRARWDAAIYSPALLAALNDAGHGDVVGAMHVAEYDESGHMVEVSEPQKLHDDVAAWLASP